MVTHDKTLNGTFQQNKANFTNWLLSNYLTNVNANMPFRIPFPPIRTAQLNHINNMSCHF